MPLELGNKVRPRCGGAAELQPPVVGHRHRGLSLQLKASSNDTQARGSLPELKGQLFTKDTYTYTYIYIYIWFTYLYTYIYMPGESKSVGTWGDHICVRIYIYVYMYMYARLERT